MVPHVADDVAAGDAGDRNACGRVRVIESGPRATVIEKADRAIRANDVAPGDTTGNGFPWVPRAGVIERSPRGAVVEKPWVPVLS